MTFRKAVSLILAVLMIMSAATVFVSCNKDSDPLAKIPKTKRTHVYKETLLENGDITGYVDNIFLTGDKLFVKNNVTYTIVRDGEGKEVERFEGYYYDYSGGVYEVPIAYDDGFIAYAEDVLKSSAIELVDTEENEVDEAEPAVDVEPFETPEDDAATDNAVIIDPGFVGPVKPFEPGIDEEFEIEGEPDEFGVIIDENYNIKVPDGLWVEYLGVDVLTVFSINGGEKRTVEIDMSDVPVDVSNGWMRDMFIGKDGAPMMLYNVYNYDPETYEGSEEYYILTVDLATGKASEPKLLNNSFAKAEIDPMNMYLQSIEMLSDGNYYLNVGDGFIYVVDGDMNFVRKISVGDGYINRMIAFGDTLLASMYDINYTTETFYIIENGQVTPATNTNDLGGYVYNIIGADGSKLFFRKEMGVWYYDVATGEYAEELNFLNSDIDYTNMNSIYYFEPGKMLMTSTNWDENGGKTTTSILTKVPDEEIKEEIIITVGSLYSDYNLVKAIMAYNKQSDGIRISIKTYENYNNEENEWKGAATQLNNEIVTGALPDIVMLDSQMPTQSYFQKGVFIDLNKYIDDDEKGLDRTKYLDNILRANETNGKLYSLITDYGISTLAAKTKFVGEKEGWTFDQMMDVIANMPEGMEAFYGESRDTVLYTIVGDGIGGLVNWETGDTKFDSQPFIDFIKYLATCPEKGMWAAYYDEMNQGDEYVYDEEKEREITENMALRFWNDKSLLCSSGCSSFDSVAYIYRTFASRDITFIGYPTDKAGSNGAVIMPYTEFAISAKSPAKDQAWDFLKYYMENSGNDYIFSLSREKMQKFADQTLEDAERYGYGYYTEDYEWLKQMGYSDDYINFQLNSNVTIDKEMIDMAWHLIETADTVARSDEELTDIINEELSAFFAGTKSAEETGRVIASRAKIMISTKS